jgi:hypothetical protein
MSVIPDTAVTAEGEPEWTADYGPSFDYRDPDGNGIELPADDYGHDLGSRMELVDRNGIELPAYNCGHDLGRWIEFVEGRLQRSQMGINAPGVELPDAE